MARPSKDTVDYFPHYVSHGKTMFTLEAKFGNDGYAVWFKLLEELGSTSGHFVDIKETETWVYLVAKFRVDEQMVKSILDTLSMLRAIDPDLYADGIIWSDNFLSGLTRVYNKRASEIPQKPSFRAGNPVEDQLPAVSVPKTPQSIVKESKVKNIPLGVFGNVFLSEEEMEKLSSAFGDKITAEKINSLSEYMKSKGKSYKSHYATILSWDRKDKREGRPGRAVNEDSEWL